MSAWWRFKCKTCGKITAGRRPGKTWYRSDGTAMFPRRHNHNGKPCPGNIEEAEWIKPEQQGGGMKFRKKPVVIEAIQYVEGNRAEIVEFTNRGISGGMNDRRIWIHTLEGTMEANYGDWIIKGIKGEFYPCKPDIFEATYEPAHVVSVTPLSYEELTSLEG